MYDFKKSPKPQTSEVAEQARKLAWEEMLNTILEARI